MKKQIILSIVFLTAVNISFADEYKILFKANEKPFISSETPTETPNEPEYPSTACVFGDARAVFWLQWPNQGGHAWLNFNTDATYPHHVGDPNNYVTNLNTPVDTFYSAYPNPTATYNGLVDGSIDPKTFLDSSIFNQEFLHNGYYFKFGDYANIKQTYYDGGMLALHFELCHRPE